MIAAGTSKVEGVVDELVSGYQKARPMVDELVSAFTGKGVEASLAGELASLALSTIGSHQVQAAQAVAPSSDAPVAQEAEPAPAA